MNFIKAFDPLKYAFLASVIFFYLKGYGSYHSGSPQETGAWAVICAVCLLCLIKRFRYVRYLHMRMKKVDKLSGKAFESYLIAQFKHMGYRVFQTEDSHDYGADLLLKKRGESIVVQAKRYDRNVGLSAVQEAVGAVAYYGADRAMVVTNSGFTKSAKNLARQNDVELWDREEIKKRFLIR